MKSDTMSSSWTARIRRVDGIFSSKFPPTAGQSPPLPVILERKTFLSIRLFPALSLTLTLCLTLNYILAIFYGGDQGKVRIPIRNNDVWMRADATWSVYIPLFSFSKANGKCKMENGHPFSIFHFSPKRENRTYCSIFHFLIFH